MPQYAVTTENSVVSVTSSENGAVDFAIKTNPHAKYVPFATETDILNDDEQNTGYYIVTDGRVAKLVEKYKITVSGIIFNSIGYEIRIVKEWKIIAFTDESLQKFDNVSGSVLTNTVIPNTDTNSDLKTKQITTKLTQTSTKQDTICIPKTINYSTLSDKSRIIISIANILSRNKQNDVINRYVNTMITSKTVREEDIVIFTYNDITSTRWSKQLGLAFVYGQPNEDMMYYLTSLIPPKTPKDTDKIFKLVIFDNCMSKQYISKPHIKKIMDNIIKNNIGMIIMTGDNDTITHEDILKNVDTAMLHSLTMNWTTDSSHDFINRFPLLKDQREIEKMMSYVAGFNSFLVVHSAPNTNVIDFLTCQY